MVVVIQVGVTAKRSSRPSHPPGRGYVAAGGETELDLVVGDALGVRLIAAAA